MTPQAALERGLDELGLALGIGARDSLHEYLVLLAKWNRTYNLTAIRDPLKMVTHHLLDSLTVLPQLPAGALADVGSGAGLPGIPIAIAEPERAVSLADANQKKCAFLRQAVMQLGLANAHVHHGRADNWRPQARFAVVISRGFAELAEFFAACRHLVAPGGVLAAMKGVYPLDEMAQLPADCRDCEVRALRVPLLNAQRHLVLCRLSV